MPEAELLENNFYMSENLNTENNLLVPSTRRNLFKGVATGLVAGSVAGPAILSGAKKGKKAGGERLAGGKQQPNYVHTMEAFEPDHLCWRQQRSIML